MITWILVLTSMNTAISVFSIVFVLKEGAAFRKWTALLDTTLCKGATDILESCQQSDWRIKIELEHQRIKNENDRLKLVVTELSTSIKELSEKLRRMS